VALAEMQAELHGSLPKFPMSYTNTVVNRAWKDVRTRNLWSFQLYESSWITPPLINTGSVTVTQGSPNIKFDPTAVAAINAAQLLSPFSLITQRQFRSGSSVTPNPAPPLNSLAPAGIGGIYNLIFYNHTTGVATLDRMYGDPGGQLSYQIYQLYYTPPFIDHRTFFTVRNMYMFLDMELRTTRTEIDGRDPQRTWYQFPTHVVPFGLDLRGQGTNFPSTTLGYPFYELWGQPVSPFTYQCYGIRYGADLVNPQDTLPFQIPEELVVTRARYLAYEWAEANKDIVPRAQGPDWRFLMGAVDKEYTKLLTRYRLADKELIDNFFIQRNPSLASRAYGYYNTLAGFAGPNAQM
jgi:hypothetical protein